MDLPHALALRALYYKLNILPFQVSSVAVLNSYSNMHLLLCLFFNTVECDQIIHYL